MILLSRLIKSSWPAQEETKNKIISIKSFRVETEEEVESPNQAPIIEQSDEIIENARKEAEAIIAEARALKEATEQQLQLERESFEQELVRISEQARQDGFQAGFQEGEKLGYEEAFSLIEEAKRMVVLSKEDYQKKIESAEFTILDLGMKVAERILGVKLDSEPDVFLSVVKRALKEAREYEEVGLHIHPSRYEFLLSQKDDLITIFPKETEFYIYPDADLSEDSCMIESASGRIDASVDVQLEEVKNKLREMMESE